jgi:hypothetical protein
MEAKMLSEGPAALGIQLGLSIFKPLRGEPRDNGPWLSPCIQAGAGQVQKASQSLPHFRCQPRTRWASETRLILLASLLAMRAGSALSTSSFLSIAGTLGRLCSSPLRPPVVVRWQRRFKGVPRVRASFPECEA